MHRGHARGGRCCPQRWGQPTTRGHHRSHFLQLVLHVTVAVVLFDAAALLVLLVETAWGQAGGRHDGHTAGATGCGGYEAHRVASRRVGGASEAHWLGGAGCGRQIGGVHRDAVTAWSLGLGFVQVLLAYTTPVLVWLLVRVPAQPHKPHNTHP